MPVWPPGAFTSGLPIPGKPEIAGYSYGATWGLAPAGLAPASLTASFAALPPLGPPRRVPQLPRYYGAVRLPVSLSPRFVAFAWRYPALCRSFAPVGPGHPTAGQGLRFRSPPPDFYAGRQPGPPRFPDNPLSLCPVLRPRQDRTHQAIAVCRHGPSYDHNEGSHDSIQLSRLNRTALGLAVYASSGALPRKTQNSLPAASQALPDGLGYPQGCYERFPTVVVLLSRAFPGARTYRVLLSNSVCP
jgi:hypothetical protein